MSHTVAIKTQLNNLETLERSFNKLGWVLKKNSKIRTYPYDPQRNKIYDLIAVNPDKGHYSYDVGISFDKEQNVQLYYDPHGGSIERSLGNKFAKLKTEYVIDTTKQYYEDVEIMEMLADGSLIIEADDGL